MSDRLRAEFVPCAWNCRGKQSEGMHTISPWPHYPPLAAGRAVTLKRAATKPGIAIGGRPAEAHRRRFQRRTDRPAPVCTDRCCRTLGCDGDRIVRRQHDNPSRVSCRAQRDAPPMTAPGRGSFVCLLRLCCATLQRVYFRSSAVHRRRSTSQRRHRVYRRIRPRHPDHREDSGLSIGSRPGSPSFRPRRPRS